MKIQGETTVYHCRSGFVQGEVTAYTDEENKVLLMLGGGLSVSLPVEYARSLMKDILEALVRAKGVERQQEREAADKVYGDKIRREAAEREAQSVRDVKALTHKGA